MKYFLLWFIVTISLCNSTLAAEESSLIVPFPETGFSTTATTFYCNAILGTDLTGHSKQDRYVVIGVAKPQIVAKAYKGTDKLVIELSGNNLYLFQRKEFESGKIERNSPFKIIENTDVYILALANGPVFVHPVGATIVTINKKTGVGTWTSVYGEGLMSDSPGISSIYMSCGGRKE